MAGIVLFRRSGKATGSVKRGRLGKWLAIAVIALGCGTTLGWWYLAQRPLWKARAAHARQQWQTALDWLGPYVRAHPEHAQARLLVARTLAHLGRYQEAEQFFAKFSALEQQDLVLRAEGLTQMGRLSDAVRVYEEMLKRDPRDVLALKRLSILQLTQHGVGQASQLARQLAQIPEAETTAYCILGVIMHELDPSMAVDYFEKVRNKSHDFEGFEIPAETLWRDYGKALLKVGRLADCRRALERLEIDQDPELLCLLAESYQQEGHHEFSEQYLRRALVCDAKYGPALLGLGQIALDEGQPEKALAHLLRARSALPKSQEVHYTLGRVYQRLGQDAEAQQAFAVAEQLR